jgi:hypothetical protein
MVLRRRWQVRFLPATYRVLSVVLPRRALGAALPTPGFMIVEDLQG